MLYCSCGGGFMNLVLIAGYIRGGSAGLGGNVYTLLSVL